MSRTLLPVVFMALSLSGCGSSSSTSEGGLLDDPTGTDTGNTDTGTDTSGTDDGGTDTGTDTSGTDAGGTDTGTDTSGTDAGGSDTGTDTSGTDDGGTDTGSDTGGTDTGGTDTGSGTDKPPGENPDILIPVVESGSDLERLLNDIHLQVSNTLLDLNQRLSSGMDLSEQQDNCIGAYDPAVGEQLTSIDCGDRPLATGNVTIYVGEAAFYDTDSCNASLFDGNTSNCQLQSASLTVPDAWTLPAGERRPVLTFAGVLIDYATKDTSLRIDNNEAALAGYFNCTVDLVTGDSSAIEAGASCDSTIASTADHLDTLLSD